jgi:hypothetical protein
MAGMLRRLLLTLLTLCLALPAALPVEAAVQPAPFAMTEHHRHHQPADHAQHDQGKHGCIGCATPVGRGPELLGVPQLRGPSNRPALAVRLPETRAGPEVPPPRF